MLKTKYNKNSCNKEESSILCTVVETAQEEIISCSSSDVIH